MDPFTTFHFEFREQAKRDPVAYREYMIFRTVFLIGSVVAVALGVYLGISR